MSEFKKAIELLVRLHNRLFNAYLNFYIWEAFQELMTPNVVGKDEAKKNVKAINNYREFFIPTISAHNKIFIMELAKFFDIDKSTLSISKIINYLGSNQKKITVEEFKKYNRKRECLSNLVKSYQGITNNCLNECKEKLHKEGLNVEDGKIIKNSKIWKLKQLRDQWIAHDQINKNDVNFTNVEIKELFNIAGKIINKISSKLNHETTWHNHSSNYAKDELMMMIDKLQNN